MLLIRITPGTTEAGAEDLHLLSGILNLYRVHGSVKQKSL
jgi:hypothetical protein